MITHRMSTHAPEPPVRLYKIIAVSFLIVTVLLLGIVILVTAKTATITILAKDDAKTIALNVDVALNGGSSKGTVAGVVSSTEFAWSESFSPTGSTTVDQPATGLVTIYNKMSVAQPLVKTTRLLTPDGILFRLSEGTTVPANGQVTAKVYADKAGASGDVGPSQFTIPGLSASKQQLVYAQSMAAMSGGSEIVGTISADDIQSAENTYKQKVTSAFLAEHPASGSLIAVAEVAEQNIASDHQPGDTVPSFTISGTSTIVDVAYSPADLSNVISENLNSKIDATAEKILSLSQSPTITISQYNLDQGTATLAVNQPAVVTLDASVPKLLPQNFFGKNKDEIERYVLGLDHVAEVDVSFSPPWVVTAPNVADKVHIIVKNTQ